MEGIVQRAGPGRVGMLLPIFGTTGKDQSPYLESERLDALISSASEFKHHFAGAPILPCTTRL